MPTKKVSKTSLSGAALASAINKKFGAGTLGFASDPSLEITRIPSGILSLDYIMNGGWARGRHSELYGPFSVGKTLITLVSIATAQADGLKCAFADAEKTFDPVFAEQLGVKLKNLAFPLRKRRTGEETIDIIESLLYSDEYDLIVLDSIASLLPQEEQEESIAKKGYSLYQAKLMSKGLRKLTTANQNTVLIYINQLRDSIGTMFGPASVTSGGRAMGFYAGTRLEFSKIEDLKEPRTVFDARKLKDVTKPVKYGHRVLIRITKDKTGAQAQDECSFVFNSEKGFIDRTEDLIYLGRRLRLIRASGDPEQLWLAGNPSKKFKGRKALKKFLETDETAAQTLEEKILEGTEDD